VREVVIGRSVQGRPLAGVEIADGVTRTDDGRPVVVHTGLIHAREWTSGELVMEFARELATEGGTFARLRAHERTFLFPVLNPDGFVVSRTTDPQRRTNADGVDLNRNAGAFWGGPGASDDPSSELYRGPRPFSEPEAEAIHAFSERHQVAVMDLLHSYGGTVLYQPGFRASDEPGLPAGKPVPGHRRLEAVARQMAAAAGYEAEPASDPSDITGATEDWNYFNQFATAFTIEVGHDEFQPDYQDGVVDQYTGAVDGPRDRAAGRRASSGVRQALLDLGAAALRRPTELRGTAPAGATLRLRRTIRYPTSYVESGTDTARPTAGPSRTLHDRLVSSLTVPASGRFTWHVDPSVRPLDVLAKRCPAWRLDCRSATRHVVVRAGTRHQLHLRCRV
jgi:hypothetical protein